MPTAGAVIISDPTTLMNGASDAATTPAAEITIDTTNRTIRINPGSGILPDAEDGVTGQALYSALKLLWKNSSTYIKYPFPMEAITPEQFEFINGWIPYDNETRKALRTCGWVERSAAGVELRKYSGIISLGSLGDTDQPYYQQFSTTGAPVNFTFTGPVNEAISTKITAAIPAASVSEASDNFTLLNNGLVNGDRVLYTQGGALTGLTTGNYYYVVNAVEATGVFQVSATSGGSAVTFTGTPSGTYTFTKDSTTFCKLFAREYQKTYSDADLADIGVTTMKEIVYRFPLANSADSLKVTAAGTGGDYDKILITYLRDSNNSFSTYTVKGTIAADTAYVKSDVVMGSNNRWYNCILGFTTPGSPTQPASDATHWAAYEGEKSFDGGTTYYPYTVVIDADNTAAAGASGVNTAQKIYERIQYELRQTYDIDDNTNGLVTGKTADALLRFVGDTLVTSNGVFIESINSNDTNSIEFYDGMGVKRQYPYTASGSFEFNSYLVTEPLDYAIYRLFYKSLQGATRKFGQSGAVLVKNASNVDLAGDVDQVASIGFSYAYDGNTQAETQWQASTTYAVGDEYKNGTTWYRVHTGYTSGGTFGATDTTNSNALSASDGPTVVAVAIGTGLGQYVSTETKITRSTGQKINLTAAQERNYQNA